MSEFGSVFEACQPILEGGTYLIFMIDKIDDDCRQRFTRGLPE